MDPILSALTLAGSFVASSFALVHYTLRENRNISDRFTSYLERSLNRQEVNNTAFRSALDKLGHSVEENSAVLSRIMEKVSH